MISSLFWHVTNTGPIRVELFTYMCKRVNATKSLSANQDSCLTTRGLLKLPNVPKSQWRAGIEHCVCINTLCERSALINVSSSVKKNTHTHTILSAKRQWIKNSKINEFVATVLKKIRLYCIISKYDSFIHVWGEKKQKTWCTENAYTKHMYTYFERYLGVLPKKKNN